MLTFSSSYFVPYDIRLVRNVLSGVDSYKEWMPGSILISKPSKSADVVVKSGALYSLRLTVVKLRSDRASVVFTFSGDLEGSFAGRLQSVRGGTSLSYRQRCDAKKRSLKYISFLFKGWVKSNHRKVMQTALQGLLLQMEKELEADNLRLARQADLVEANNKKRRS